MRPIAEMHSTAIRKILEQCVDEISRRDNYELNIPDVWCTVDHEQVMFNLKVFLSGNPEAPTPKVIERMSELEQLYSTPSTDVSPTDIYRCPYCGQLSLKYEHTSNRHRVYCKCKTAASWNCGTFKNPWAALHNWLATLGFLPYHTPKWGDSNFFQYWTALKRSGDEE